FHHPPRFRGRGPCAGWALPDGKGPGTGAVPVFRRSHEGGLPLRARGESALDLPVSLGSVPLLDRVSCPLVARPIAAPSPVVDPVGLDAFWCCRTPSRRAWTLSDSSIVAEAPDALHGYRAVQGSRSGPDLLPARGAGPRPARG